MNSVIHPSDDDLVFLDEADTDESSLDASLDKTWRIMIIDDDPDVHSATTFALGSLEIQQRSLSFLHAYSAAEARDILAHETDIAIILLDVVMEQEDAGLQLVSHIRNTLGLTDVRIILRTGQPGYAPEIDAIRDYDINDYKTKSELTRTKLYTAVTSAIRSYEQIRAISASRRGLERIIQSSTDLIATHGISNFASAVLSQICGLLGLHTEGFVALNESSEASQDETGLTLISTTQAFAAFSNNAVESVANSEIIEIIRRTLSSRQSVFEHKHTSLFFNNFINREFVLYLNCGLQLNEIDKRLLSVFCSNVSVALDNVILTSRLHDQAFFDPLTGLSNRLKLLQSLNQTLSSPIKNNSTLSLIDIDHFAETNDALGHQFGDLLLSAVAQRLREAFASASDLARVGSDTFALLGDEQVVTPQSILDLFTKPFNVDQQDVQLSATVGLIHLNDYEGDSSDALKDTNIALKRAKTSQRGGYEYFTRNMGVEIRERVMLMHALRSAFEREKLFLVYQPQLDMRNGKVIGAEALLRWKNDEGKFIRPDLFIPIAEYSGMIVEIGTWVLKTACKELAELSRSGYSDFRMAVNVSQVQFSHPLFLQSLQEILQETAVSPHQLELEITESMAMKDPDLLIKTLHQIKQLGIHVAIDDFGTGFSSLSYLQKLAIDKLKIDRAFINEIQSQAEQGSIARMIVQLGKNMGLAIIAEGVENDVQVQSLLSYDCHYAQGYYYCHPLNSEQLHSWLLQRQTT